ncbi:protein roadkill-like [Schistocerca serialis cubense]|uniref:protein roadkill-like n=1 Tax=Schistocerca serialis cubense TaxID=2023355 RepID=UPI00214EA9A5|nr:protein roadkill-like [Schistocerca serialis cubense]
MRANADGYFARIIEEAKEVMEELDEQTKTIQKTSQKPRAKARQTVQGCDEPGVPPPTPQPPPSRSHPVAMFILQSSRLVPDEEVEQTEAVDLSTLLDAGDGAVLTLVAGDTRLVAHKAVLAARSPVFATMFRHGTLETRSTPVVIPDVEGPVLRQLVTYMYTLCAPQPPGMAVQLLIAADRYSVLPLKAACEQQVVAQLSVENVVSTAVLAVRHSLTCLKQAAIAFIRAHIYEVLGTKGWTDAMHTQPEDLGEVIQLLSGPTAETSVATADEEEEEEEEEEKLHRENGVTVPTEENELLGMEEKS